MTWQVAMFELAVKLAKNTDDAASKGQSWCACPLTEAPHACKKIEGVSNYWSELKIKYKTGMIEEHCGYLRLIKSAYFQAEEGHQGPLTTLRSKNYKSKYEAYVCAQAHLTEDFKRDFKQALQCSEPPTTICLLRLRSSRVSRSLSLASDESQQHSSKWSWSINISIMMKPK